MMIIGRPHKYDQRKYFVYIPVLIIVEFYTQSMISIHDLAIKLALGFKINITSGQVRLQFELINLSTRPNIKILLALINL